MSDSTVLDMTFEFKDEIFSSCSKCKGQALQAYWDSELEYYMYSKLPLLCKNCYQHKC